MKIKPSSSLTLSMLIGLFSITTLSGCVNMENSSWPLYKMGSNKITIGKTSDYGRSSYSNSGGKYRELAKKELSFELIRFTDNRPADNFMSLVENNVIYEYSSDKLLQNISYAFPNLLTRFLKFGNQSKKTTFYKVEIDLNRMRTIIATGDIISGAYGKYITAIEADVLIRDKSSRIIVKKPITIIKRVRRNAIKGEHPPATLDKQIMLRTTKEAIKELATEAAWLAYKNTAKKSSFSVFGLGRNKTSNNQNDQENTVSDDTWLGDGD